MSKLFEDFEIYGIPDSDETCILASLLTGEPALLVGPPGTAKTEIIYMIGSAFKESSRRKNPNNSEKWFRFNVYDTSKINFEDLIGWPNPNALKDGRIDFIQSPTTIWDKDLIGLDELNRCAEDRQANLFEVIRNRTCMGSPTKVKFIFSAINPFGDAGTNNLSSAIIDRHIFFLHFAGFDKMTSDIRKKIIDRVGSFDSIGLKHWSAKKTKFDSNSTEFNDNLADQGDRLIEIIKEAVEIYPVIQDQISTAISGLIDTLITRFSTEKENKNLPSISGRRAGMISRGIIAYRAVQIARAKHTGTTPDNIKNTVINTILSTLPIGIDKPVNPDVYTRIKQIVIEVCNYWEKTLDGNNSIANNSLYDIYYNPDPMVKLEMLLNNSHLNNLVTTKAWKDLSQTDLETSTILFYLKRAIPDAIPDYVISKEKSSEIQKYTDSLLTSIDLAPHCDIFAEELSNLLDSSKHKYNVTYVCAIFGVIRINKITKTPEEVQLALKVINNLMARCTEMLDERAKTNETKKE